MSKRISQPQVLAYVEQRMQEEEAKLASLPKCVEHYVFTNA
jgi:hypothetical protein